MPGTAAGTHSFNTRMVFSATSATEACFGDFLPGTTMFGLRHRAFELHPRVIELLVEHLQGELGDLGAAVDVVIAVHDHFRLDDRHDAFVLAERGIAGERMRIGIDASIARNAGADIDHRAPFGELGAEPPIFGEPLAQAVEAFGDHLARTERQGMRALVHLDAGERAGGLDDLDEGGAVLGLLPDGLVIEDHAGDVAHALGAEQELAIVAAIVLGAFDADGVEALLDGARGFVRGENAPSRSHHGVGNAIELSKVHVSLPFLAR